MALWGNKDSKSATGTVSIANTGVVTGSSTLFTTEAKVGNALLANAVEYQIVSITSNTVAKVIMGTNNGNGTVTTCSAQSYTLSEKPAHVAHGSADTFAMGRSGLVFGVDATEAVSGGDNVSAVSVASGGARYLEVPSVTIAAPVSQTILTTAVNTTADTITVTSHRMLTGAKLTYSAASGTVLGGLSDATAYFAILVDANTLKVASSLANAQAGTAINLTGTGNSSQTFTGDTATATAAISGGAVSAITVTNVGSAYLTAPTVTIAIPRRTIPTTGITIGTDTIAYTAHGLSAGDAVKYFHGGGTAATGLTNNTTYYVIASGLTANAFKVSATDGGTTIDISGTGNNAQYFELATAVATIQATAVADQGYSANGSGSGISATHAGWVRRTVGTGGRAGRVFTETLVAMGSMSSDASDDTVLPDA